MQLKQTGPETGMAPVGAAIALTPRERRGIVEAFFAAHPGAGEGRFGLGRAILDFQAWEIASGRITGDGGSDWWRGTNGLMVLDILAAHEDSMNASGAVAAWRTFASAGEAAQQALWEAHQRSLHAALRSCQGLLEHESAAERAFARIVVDIVDRTALTASATDSPDLAHLTERYYPGHYPVAQDALPALEHMRERTSERMRGPDGMVLANVGLDSTRWD